jgi:hypothetical protein
MTCTHNKLTTIYYDSGDIDCYCSRCGKVIDIASVYDKVGEFKHQIWEEYQYQSWKVKSGY